MKNINRTVQSERFHLAVAKPKCEVTEHRCFNSFKAQTFFLTVFPNFILLRRGAAAASASPRICHCRHCQW